MASLQKSWLCWGAALLVAGGMAMVCLRRPPPDGWPTLEAAGDFPPIEIQHPLAGAALPRHLPSPVVLWNTNIPGITRWAAGIKTRGQRWLFSDIAPMWRPAAADWSGIQEAAKGEPIELYIAGYGGRRPGRLKARSCVRFTVAGETVDAPLFYREVNLPFIDAVKDPSRIRWRFGKVDNPATPVVLENLPVCGNCHSFSRGGEYLAMDVDYANSKGSYIIAKTAPEMRLSTSEIITWDDFKRAERRQTFGLLSQISPDGRYVLSTVQDRSVFVPQPSLAFSQLFFPLRGIIGVYDREQKRFAALPGADDPDLVQSNPTWSPDGQWVVFARTRAAEAVGLGDPGSILLTADEYKKFLQQGKEFRYDLYRVPFNGGKGGKAEPVPGASANGRSNFFPKYSPDGKWIIFCQATQYMLLQPDSELFIIPAAGGQARRLGCNLGRMNSWHTWSPDGRWLVFASKAHSDYTQLYLSRISAQGEASPPVWLAHLVAPGRAANIPEFVDLPEQAIVKIREQFLDDYSFTRAGNEFFKVGDADKAIEKYRTALSLNPNNATAHQRLGFLLYLAKHQPQEAMEHMQAAVRLEPNNPFARFDLGNALANSGDLSNAVVHLSTAVRLLPNGFDRQYSAVNLNYALAEVYYRLELYSESLPVLETVRRHDPSHARANYLLAMAKTWQGETDATTAYYETAIRSDPQLAQLPDYWELLGRNYFQQGWYAEAAKALEKAYQLAVAANRGDQAARLQQRITFCRSRQ